MGEESRAFRIEPDTGNRKPDSIRVHPGAGALKGALASNKGRGLSFNQIRKAAAAERSRDRE